MSLWFKPIVFKFKKGIPAVIMECPLILFGSVIFALRRMPWIAISYIVRYAAGIFIAEIIIVTLARIGTFNAVVPFAFITMAFGFDQHRSKLNA